MRVFLDANILWSAAHHPGAVRALLVNLGRSSHVLVVDGYVVEEAARNLPVAKHATLRELLRGMELDPGAMPADGVACHGLPDKDAPVLRAAVRLRCDCLVTGDRRHFGHLMGKRPEGVLVLAPADAVILLAR